MKCVSAYDFNDRLIEGRVYTNKKGESFIINEFGESLSTNNIKTYRLYEELEGDEVQDIVDKELSELDVENNDKLKDLSSADLEKTADKREKELQSEGMEIKDGDYKNKFITSVKVADATDGVEAGTTSDSEALQSVVNESENIYDLINKEIDKYTESTAIFEEDKLLEQLCTTFKKDVNEIKGKTLSESIKNIVKSFK